MVHTLVPLMPVWMTWTLFSEVRCAHANILDSWSWERFMVCCWQEWKNKDTKTFYNKVVDVCGWIGLMWLDDDVYLFFSQTELPIQLKQIIRFHLNVASDRPNVRTWNRNILPSKYRCTDTSITISKTETHHVW